MANAGVDIHLHGNEGFTADDFTTSATVPFVTVGTNELGGANVKIFMRTIEQLDSLISAATEAREMLRKGLEEKNV